MLGSLGGWLRRLFRSDAVGQETQARAPQAPVPSHIEQHAHASGAIQFAHVESIEVKSLQVIHSAAQSDVELHTLQVAVMRLLDGAGNRREAIESFMRREFGTSRVMHLSQPQLYRTQRYCETIQARRKPRGQSEARP